MKLVCYVDGSYSNQLKNFSYGVVVIEDGKVVSEESGIGNDEEVALLRNVAGEVMGAIRAVEIAKENNYDELDIFYDYKGIECWALGTWKRNNNVTKGYHEYMQEAMKDINITFHKVKGHSGDEYNDRADKLAKNALGIK